MNYVSDFDYDCFENVKLNLLILMFTGIILYDEKKIN